MLFMFYIALMAGACVSSVGAVDVRLLSADIKEFKVPAELLQYSGYLSQLPVQADARFTRRTTLSSQELSVLVNILQHQGNIYRALVENKLVLPAYVTRATLQKFMLLPALQAQFDNVTLVKTVDNKAIPVTKGQLKLSHVLSAMVDDLNDPLFIELPHKAMTAYNIAFLFTVLGATAQEEGATTQSWELGDRINNIIYGDRANIGKKDKRFDQRLRLTMEQLYSLFEAADFLEFPLSVRYALMQIINARLEEEKSEEKQKLSDHYKDRFQRLQEEMLQAKDRLFNPTDKTIQDVINNNGLPAIITDKDGVKRFILQSRSVTRLKGLNHVAGIDQVAVISLGGNKIRFITMDDCAGLTALQTLNLPDNSIKSIETGWDRHLPHLTKVDLSRNELTIIKPGMFRSPTLEVLDLSHNKIVAIEENAFAALPKLRELNLVGNDIKNLPQSLKRIPVVKLTDESMVDEPYYAAYGV